MPADALLLWASSTVH